MNQQGELITLAHGAGGKTMQNFIDSLFLKAFGDTKIYLKEDQARLRIPDLADGKLAFTTDSYVVSPINFPGGDIGKLAVCGTVNDLAVGGAIPLYLSAGFILEEGLPIAELASIVTSMAQTAKAANVQIVTGDTKVVERGKADKVFINTSGIGVIPHQLKISVSKAQPGDKIIINSSIGDHGAAIMLARGELGLSAEIMSDCAALNHLITSVIESGVEVHCMRDATRGGVGAVLNEIAQASKVTIELEQALLPIKSEVNSVCDLLGLEPLFLANEGLVVFVIPQISVEKALQVMGEDLYGKQATVIGTVTESSDGLLYIKTEYGGKRMLDVPYGLQLPRIC